jgi:hypothetical protein
MKETRWRRGGKINQTVLALWDDSIKINFFNYLENLTSYRKYVLGINYVLHSCVQISFETIMAPTGIERITR